jgi:predicted MFS family arabinose efflux permease
VIGILVAAAAVLAVWVWWELRAAQPLVALRLLGERAVLTASVATLLASVGMYLLISPVTTLVQTPRSTGYGLGGTVVVAGLVLVPFSATSYLITRVVPWLVRRTSYEVVLPLSSAMMLASMVLFSVARDNIWEIVVVMAIAGVGTGSIFAVMPGYLMRAVPAHETSSAMSFNQILRYVGYSTGGALGAVLLQAHTTPGQSLPANSGYSIIGVVGGLGWVLTAAAAILLPLGRRPRPDLAQQGERTPAIAVVPETATESVPGSATNGRAIPQPLTGGAGVSGRVRCADHTSLGGGGTDVDRYRGQSGGHHPQQR